MSNRGAHGVFIIDVYVSTAAGKQVGSDVPIDKNRMWRGHEGCKEREGQAAPQKK